MTFARSIPCILSPQRYVQPRPNPRLPALIGLIHGRWLPAGIDRPLRSPFLRPPELLSTCCPRQQTTSLALCTLPRSWGKYPEGGMGDSTPATNKTGSSRSSLGQWRGVERRAARTWRNHHQSEPGARRPCMDMAIGRTVGLRPDQVRSCARLFLEYRISTRSSSSRFRWVSAVQRLLAGGDLLRWSSSSPGETDNRRLD